MTNDTSLEHYAECCMIFIVVLDITLLCHYAECQYTLWGSAIQACCNV
jgi:hypothetical protein